MAVAVLEPTILAGDAQDTDVVHAIYVMLGSLTNRVAIKYQHDGRMVTSR